METNRDTKKINTVTEGKAVQCPQCGFSNESNSKFCEKCGTTIVNNASKTTNDDETQNLPFKKINETLLDSESPSNNNIENVATEKSCDKITYYEEENLVFAQGLPEWSPNPPTVLVRRVQK